MLISLCEEIILMKVNRYFDWDKPALVFQDNSSHWIYRA